MPSRFLIKKTFHVTSAAPSAVRVAACVGGTLAMADVVSINSWQSVENLILRPPRSDAYTREDLLGSHDGEFTVTGVDGGPVRCFRMDVEARARRLTCWSLPAALAGLCQPRGRVAAPARARLHSPGALCALARARARARARVADWPPTGAQLKNARGLRLVCSHYLPCERWKAERQLPCVVYLHGNAGCRVDANVVAFALLRRGISCFCFDFSGSGQSDGDLVTLGAREAADLDTVVSFLRVQGRTSHIALWGRSMGAVTGALYARTNLSIAGVVLDSPFARLTDLIRDIVARDIVAEAPGVLVSAAILALRTSIRRRTGVDIAAIDALAGAPECYQPALFVHAREDELIYPSHSDALSQAWSGDCRMLLVGEGQSHNTLRPRHIISSCVTFLCNVLGGGLKDAEALFRDVGNGTPPPPPPAAAVDPQSARAAVLQRLWLRMADDSAEREQARDDEGSDSDDDEEEDGEGEEGLTDEEGEDEEAVAGDDSDDDWEDSAATLAATLRLQEERRAAAAAAAAAAAQP